MLTTLLSLARAALRAVADLCRRLAGLGDDAAPTETMPDRPALVGAAAGAAAGLGLPLLAGAGLAVYALAGGGLADEPALVRLALGGLAGLAAVAWPLGVALGLAALALAAGAASRVVAPVQEVLTP